MGVVYEATDLSLDRPVALKLIAPELADDPRFRERFLEEPRLAASLDHASVIPIYEAGEHEGQLYLAMRYVAGERPPDPAGARRGARPGACAGDPRPDRGCPRRGPPTRPRAPRRQARERPPRRGRARVPDGLRRHASNWATTRTSRAAARSTTSPRADPRRAGRRAHRRATRSPACSTSASRARRRSGARRRPRRCGRICARSRRRWRVDPALDPVLRRGLAQEKDDRYPTCTALIDAARDVADGRAALPASTAVFSWCRARGHRRGGKPPPLLEPGSPANREPPRSRAGTGSRRSVRRRSRSTHSSTSRARRATSSAARWRLVYEQRRTGRSSRASTLRPRPITDPGSKRRACRPTSPSASGARMAGDRRRRWRQMDEHRLPRSIPTGLSPPIRCRCPREAIVRQPQRHQRRLPADRGRRRRRYRRRAAAPSRASIFAKRRARRDGRRRAEPNRRRA